MITKQTHPCNPHLGQATVLVPQEPSIASSSPAEVTAIVTSNTVVTVLNFVLKKHLQFFGFDFFTPFLFVSFIHVFNLYYYLFIHCGCWIFFHWNEMPKYLLNSVVDSLGVFSSLGLLWKTLLWTFLYMAFGRHEKVLSLVVCFFLCLGMELVGHRVCLCSTLGYTAKVVAPVYTPCMWVSVAPYLWQHSVLSVVLILSNLIGVW